MGSIRSNIAKGRGFQKRVMLAFKEAYKLGDDDIRTAVGAEAGVDIKLSKHGQGIVGVSLECKDVKSLNIWKALEQAKSNRYDGCPEAVVFKRGTLGANTTYICLPLMTYLQRDKAALS